MPYEDQWHLTAYIVAAFKADYLQAITWALPKEKPQFFSLWGGIRTRMIVLIIISRIINTLHYILVQGMPYYFSFH